MALKSGLHTGGRSATSVVSHTCQLSRFSQEAPDFSLVLLIVLALPEIAYKQGLAPLKERNKGQPF